MIAAAGIACNVVELRRYAMRPGKRDDLIAIFERDFIEGQETCGMLPIGHYRNLDDRDEYVWFRGFPGMESRRESLEAFYDRSDVWLQNRDAANATMIDSDNVLLLRPATPEHGFDLRGLERPAIGERRPHSLVVTAIFMLQTPASQTDVAQFESDVLPALEPHAGRIAMLVTEERPNDFRHPVRTGEFALVLTGIANDLAALHAWIGELQPDRLPAQFRAKLISSEFLRLEPATRSLYR